MRWCENYAALACLYHRDTAKPRRVHTGHSQSPPSPSRLYTLVRREPTPSRATCSHAALYPQNIHTKLNAKIRPPTKCAVSHHRLWNRTLSLLFRLQFRFSFGFDYGTFLSSVLCSLLSYCTSHIRFLFSLFFLFSSHPVQFGPTCITSHFHSFFAHHDHISVLSPHSCHTGNKIH